MFREFVKLPKYVGSVQNVGVQIYVKPGGEKLADTTADVGPIGAYLSSFSKTL